MKNLKIFFSSLIGGAVFSVTFTLFLLILKKQDWFNFKGRSLQSIVIEGIILGIAFSVFMFLYSKNHNTKGRKNKDFI